MSDNCTKSSQSDIQWNLLDDKVGKMKKSSGMKIEYSMSDEIDFARKLFIQMRKQLMRSQLEDEDKMYQQELENIGLLYTTDNVCEEVRKCSQKPIKEKRKYFNNNAQKSEISKLFKMYED